MSARTPSLPGRKHCILVAMDDDGPKDASPFTFGDFAIEGLEDPLAPHAAPDYVELLDESPPPVANRRGDPNMAGYPLGQVPVAGGAARRSPRGSALRALAVIVLAAPVAALLWFLVRLLS